MVVELRGVGIDDDLRYLADEIWVLDVVRIEPVMEGAVPDGARSGLMLTDGLLLELASGPVLAALISLTQEWLRRRGKGSVKVRIGDDEIEIDGATDAMTQQALDVFTARHD